MRAYKKVLGVIPPLAQALEAVVFGGWLALTALTAVKYRGGRDAQCFLPKKFPSLSPSWEEYRDGRLKITCR